MARGMLVTLRNLLRRPITTQYPEERLTVSKRIRGTVLAWSAEKCTGCYTCQHSCPHGCIEIETSPAGNTGINPAPCTGRCPAHVDAARYIRCLSQGEPGQAVAVVREKIPFPSSCAYVCAHPCESVCTRGAIDEPIAIRMLKRYAVDNDSGEWKSGIKRAPASGKKVAVIGAGPAGLTAGYYLARAGHAVTVFEELPTPGGMMLVGIPRYRLPMDIMMDDIRAIQDAGVEIKTGTYISDPAGLLEQGYQSVLAAIGAHQAGAMGVPGDDDRRVLGGVTFLKDVSLGKKVELGKRVAVIGGGNTAIDCARTAIRMNTDRVLVVYRRTRAEMPAAPEEIVEALEEGIEFSYLAAPTRVTDQGGRLVMECIRMKLGDEDASGRRRPEPVKGSEYNVEVDNIIAAISQNPLVPDSFGLATDKSSRIQVAQDSLMTARAGIFAAGDAVLGPATVIEAIAQGRQAASAIDKYLGGSGNIDEQLARPEAIPDRRGGPLEAFRPEKLAIEHHRRLHTFDGVEIGWDRPAAECEAGRCLRCDLKYDVTKYQLKGGLCIYCGLCVEACPFNALYMGYEYERGSYRLAEQTLQKEQLLTPDVRRPSAYYHPELDEGLPPQTLLLDRDK
jgi:NADPH-dependent glutamate synthase beta subunit-like oxidoreductase/NAD-dependent dihydropyrimidine dehydrogenase PreA subunit